MKIPIIDIISRIIFNKTMYYCISPCIKKKLQVVVDVLALLIYNIMVLLLYLIIVDSGNIFDNDISNC